MSSEDKVGLTMPLDDVKSFNSGHKVEAQPEPYKLDDPSAALQRGLSSRHISIMTFSGVIGTGLFLTTGNALVNAGPLGLLLGYMLWSFFIWVTTMCVGEICTWLPIRGSFVTWAARYNSRNAACAISWNYWLTTAMTMCAEISAVNSCISIWTDVNPAAWTTIMIITYLLFNSIHVKGYGEVEFWYSIGKILLVFILMFMSFIFMLGGNPKGETFGFRYWNNPGPMNSYVASGDAGRFLGLWSVFGSAAFSLGGPEYICVTSAETVNPRRNVPKVCRRVVYRLFFLYWTTIIGMGVMVPSDSPELKDALANGSGMLQSPFIVGFTNFGLGRWFVDLSNALLIASAASCGNVFAYCSIRTLHTMAVDGMAPRIFSRTLRNGAPIYAVGLVLLVSCLSYLSCSESGAVAFGWFTGLVSVGLLANLMYINITWVYWSRALKAQDISRESLPFQGPRWIMGWAPYATIGIFILIGFTFNFQVFCNGRWDVKTFITSYFMWAFQLVIFLLAKFVFIRDPGTTPETADIWTGKSEVDADEQYWNDHYIAPTGFWGRFYEWLF